MKPRYCKLCHREIPARRGCKPDYHADCRLKVHRMEQQQEAYRAEQEAAKAQEKAQTVTSALHRSLNARVC